MALGADTVEQPRCEGRSGQRSRLTAGAFIGWVVLLRDTVCESAFCSPGWTLYVDVNGTEGSDSCISPYSNGGSSGGVTWEAANASCTTMGVGTRLLTFASLEAPTLTGSDLLSLALRVVGSQSIWVGAVRSPSSPEPTAGWSWVDGTVAANLNCGIGCGPWGAGFPRWVRVL